MKIYVLWILFKDKNEPQISVHLEFDAAEDELSEHNLESDYKDSGIETFDTTKCDL